MKTVYKVRDPQTGLYMNRASNWPSWTEDGSVFTSASAVKGSLKTRSYGRVNNTVEIVEFELHPTGKIERV